MQHRFDVVLAEYPVEQCPVTDIATDHPGTLATNAFNRVQRGFAAVAKVIQYDNFITGFKQCKCGMRADIAGATRYQNLHSAIRLWMSDK